jgi:hypothetical protein
MEKIETHYEREKSSRQRRWNEIKRLRIINSVQAKEIAHLNGRIKKIKELTNIFNKIEDIKNIINEL